MIKRHYPGVHDSCDGVFSASVSYSGIPGFRPQLVVCSLFSDAFSVTKII
jgi:hypothetical protein